MAGQLILTDNKQLISWVIPEFTKMTGYPTRFALGKTPGFLQGSGTCPETRQRIREKLSVHEIIAETILNYLKNGEPYKCLVMIVPFSQVPRGLLTTWRRKGMLPRLCAEYPTAFVNYWKAGIPLNSSKPLV